ncbi:tetratricopeptide repeat protein [Cryptosporangium sp. NPDC048952]|uniref:tetratricopeptide repeat protein n=1 Tax=Cryptosporangium sp. NPDC048952 TaxID=3363961 RepID=UPI0037175259
MTTPQHEAVNTQSDGGLGELMGRIGAAVAAHRASGGDGPREDLLAIWREFAPSPTGPDQALRRCTIAHYLADMYDDPALALMWDTRALDAAANLPAEHVGFYPSLYLNIADNLRRLRSFDAAEEYLAEARRRPPAVADDSYTELMNTAFTAVGTALRERSTAPIMDV